MANTRKIRELLTKAIFEVFETMFFVFAELAREEGRDYQMKASIRFSGRMEGAMQISISAVLAKIMAANMLNLPNGEITDSVIADCVKECINMICGSFVSKVDPDHVFQLSIPCFELVSGPSGDGDARSDDSLRLVFDAEGGGFEVMLTASDYL